jgi:hypothetical protein
MGSVRNGITSAIAVTVLALWVTWHWRPLIWRTWDNLSWARVGIFILAGTGTFPLMDIWSRTFEPGPTGPRRVGCNQVDGAPASPATQLLEGADV